MKRFIAFWVGLAIVLATVGFASNFTKTYNVPERKDRVKNEREAIAYISTDFNALIDHYNAMRTSVTYGSISIPLSAWREVDATGDVGDSTADGGVLSSNTTPIFEAINGATNKTQRLNWAASDNSPIMYSNRLPVDFSTLGDLTFQGRFGNDGSTDTTGPTVSFYFNESATHYDVTSDFTADGTADTTYILHNFTVADASMDATTDTVTIIVTPGAHTTNALYLSSTGLKYLRNF